MHVLPFYGLFCPRFLSRRWTRPSAGSDSGSSPYKDQTQKSRISSVWYLRVRVFPELWNVRLEAGVWRLEAWVQRRRADGAADPERTRSCHGTSRTERSGSSLVGLEVSVRVCASGVPVHACHYSPGQRVSVCARILTLELGTGCLSEHPLSVVRTAF